MKMVLVSSYEGNVLVKAENHKSQKELVNLARLYIQNRDREIITNLNNIEYYTPSELASKRIEMEKSGWLDNFERYTPIIEQVGECDYKILYEYEGA